MKEEAKKQFEPISIAQIKETLKKISVDKFDKMIISEEQSIKRGNYIFIKLKYEKIERQVEQIRFPLYTEVRDNFTELEGGDRKFGIKSAINSEKIFETLKSHFQITGQGFSIEKIHNPFDYPLDEVNGEISKDQKKYFFSNYTYQETCEECKGGKHVKCRENECDGRHNWSCTDCLGDGKVSCDDCGGDGRVTCENCKGGGYIKCGSLVGSNLVGGLIGSSIAGCNGKGIIYIDGGKYASGKPKPKKEKQCSQCRGKGEVICKDCGSRGEVKCDNCSGRGEVKCCECLGKGNITCSICYGDKEKYGKIDCPECKTIGIIGQIIYVNSFVSQNSNEKIILKGEKLNIPENSIQSHVKSIKEQLIYHKVNEKIENNYDEYSKEYAEIFEKDLNLNKENFPLLTKEEMFYQIVPCVELSYKHILTNTTHEFTIIDFFNNPEVIFHSEPEQLKQDLGNLVKVASGFFGKLFKTKSFKTKEDKRNEIVLLIHLAKADGKIEDQEKIYLSEMIGCLNDFTNSEKQKLFDVMNSETLPELTKVDVIFSSKERGQKVLNKLIELANTDGVFEPAEKALIDKINNMMM
jgi:tellurite resistance protein